ncbi:MAG: hypothetical protein JST14_16265 [Bacteroidetes bacterium]|nr:hypothetical protein [Bacteroidota bacterium]MBS1976503.1 hypothetical protein [Bacteroidota bacterium]
MKTRVKILLGMVLVTIAALALIASADTVDASSKQQPLNPCYGQSEIDLLVRGNHWTEEQARHVLDLACQYSAKPH